MGYIKTSKKPRKQKKKPDMFNQVGHTVIVKSYAQKIGQSEPAPTTIPSTGWMMLL